MITYSRSKYFYIFRTNYTTCVIILKIYLLIETNTELQETLLYEIPVYVRQTKEVADYGHTKLENVDIYSNTYILNNSIYKLYTGINIAV